jgi:hypothetical protein
MALRQSYLRIAKRAAMMAAPCQAVQPIFKKPPVARNRQLRQRMVEIYDLIQPGLEQVFLPGSPDALSVASRPPLLLRNVDRITTPTPNQFARKPTPIRSKLLKTNTYNQRKSIPAQTVMSSSRPTNYFSVASETPSSLAGQLRSCTLLALRNPQDTSIPTNLGAFF